MVRQERFSGLSVLMTTEAAGWMTSRVERHARTIKLEVEGKSRLLGGCNIGGRNQGCVEL